MSGISKSDFNLCCVLAVCNLSSCSLKTRSQRMHACALAFRKSDNLLFEFTLSDELSHCVGNCLFYGPASSICDPAQRSQHFLIEVVNRPIANPKRDKVLRESFHVIPFALFPKHSQETFGRQFYDLEMTHFAQVEKLRRLCERNRNESPP